VTIRIGSLFSGIGGLELGLESAFAESGLVADVAWQVEQAEFPRQVLAKHWPNADRSVTDVRAASVANLCRVDVLCGGPPCQDISGAGRQAGLSGERSGLLFEYIRVVRELRPRVCVVENVYGGQWRSWLDAIRCGFFGAGFSVRAGIIRASDVGAPHKRARVLVLAYPNGMRQLQPKGRKPEQRRWSCDGSQDGWIDGRFEPGLDRSATGIPAGVDLPSRWPAGRGEEQHDWEPPRATEAKQANRVARMKGLGNPVVPQVAREVGRWIVREGWLS
jgi:DNA (cytosine-5)-methyltransferase 1